MVCLCSELLPPLTAYFLAAYMLFTATLSGFSFLLRSCPHKAHPLLSVIMPRRETRKRFGRKFPFCGGLILVGFFPLYVCEAGPPTGGQSVRFFPAVSLFSPALALTGFSRAWGRKGRYSGNEVSSPASLGEKAALAADFLRGGSQCFPLSPTAEQNSGSGVRHWAGRIGQS